MGSVSSHTASRSWGDPYFRVTRSATYGFLSALPLLVIYESLILQVNAGHASQVRVGADVWIKQLMAYLGGTGMFFLGGVVFLIGLFIFFMERKKNHPLRFSYLFGMITESAFYAIGVAVVVSNLVSLLFAMVAPGNDLEQLGLGTQLALSVGAGLYEELVFRVVLVGGLYWVLAQVFSSKSGAYVCAALIGAFLFSYVHYVGPFADVFTPASFTFRFLFGLALNILFLARGFGIAAWTHALYDVMVVTHLLG